MHEIHPFLPGPGAPRAGRRVLAAAALAAGLLAAPGGAEAQQTWRMDAPDARLSEDFGAIQTVRELPDGTVLVADPLGAALYRVDLEAGTRTEVGSRGRGPAEYMQPDAVWPLPGDSTLLVDLGNGRLTRLGPDLSFGATSPIAQGEFRPGTPPVIALPQGVDDEGRVYFRSLPSPGGGSLPDSAEVLRLRPGGSVERVVRVKVPERRVQRSGGGNEQNVSIRQIPLSPEDAWGVAPDGSVAVARSEDYHVEWIGPDGAVTRGPAVAWDPVAIRGAEREEWLADRGRSGGGIAIGIEVENGRPSMSFRRGAGGGEPDASDYEWPDAKPPFVGARVPVDPLGRAWVRRHVDAGGPVLYDLFDRSGRRVGVVEMEAPRSVVGFGDAGVYVVSWDPFDLAYLERHPLPGA